MSRILPPLVQRAMEALHEKAGQCCYRPSTKGPGEDCAVCEEPVGHDCHAAYRTIRDYAMVLIRDRDQACVDRDHLVGALEDSAAAQRSMQAALDRATRRLVKLARGSS